MSHVRTIAVLAVTPTRAGALAFIAFTVALMPAAARQKAEAAARTITFEQLTEMAKIYFRDTSEFPIHQEMTLSISNSSGRVLRSKKASAELSYRGGWRHHQGRAEVNRPENPMSWILGGGAMAIAGALGNNDLLADFPGHLLILSPPEKYQLEATPGEGSLTKVRLTPAFDCPAFSLTNQPKAYLPNPPCGVSSFQLAEDLSFQHFEFEQAGLPATVEIEPFGKCVVRRYHVDVEFHKVMIPTSDDPFLVPQSAVTTLETDKGKVVISSVYEPAGPALP